MINAFKIRKITALLLMAFFPAVTYLILMTSTKNQWYALGGFFVTTTIFYFLGSMLLKNAFSSVLEGDGILFIKLDSTGVLNLFVAKVQSPFIKSKINKNNVEDVFDRDAVFNITHPAKAEIKIAENGDLDLHISKDEYNRARTQLYHLPVLIWNDQIKSFITKDFLSETENRAFTKHTLLYANRKLEELTSTMRDFARYFIELQRPGILGNKWLWIILLVGLGILAALFLPKILATMGVGGGAAAPAAAASSTPGTGLGSGIITPQ